MSSKYTIEWRPNAEKELAKLDKPVRSRIVRKVESLADDPRPYGVLKLTGPDNLWRIRIGDYRVVYTIRDDRLIVAVVRVANRGAVYREI